MTNGKDFRVLL